MIQNPHKNHRQRMFDRYAQDGFSTFEDHEILEMLLFFSIPRRNTNDAAGHGQTLHPQLHAQAVAQAAAGAFAAQGNVLTGIALVEQIPVGLQRILEGGGEGMLRG